MTARPSSALEALGMLSDPQVSITRTLQIHEGFMHGGVASLIVCTPLLPGPRTK